MAAPLRRVVVCSPETAGWSRPEKAEGWRALGYFHPPDARAAQSHHDGLRATLESGGVEVYSLPPSDTHSLDAVYAHDASLATDFGAILLRMGKPARAPEPAFHGTFYRRMEIPVLGEIEPPGTLESGDLVWLGPSLLLAGRGYRTNLAGIEQLRDLLSRGRGHRLSPTPWSGSKRVPSPDVSDERPR